MNLRIVNVIRESTILKQRPLALNFCSLVSEGAPATRITFSELYDTLASGKPGDYILVGA